MHNKNKTIKTKQHSPLKKQIELNLIFILNFQVKYLKLLFIQYLYDYFLFCWGVILHFFWTNLDFVQFCCNPVKKSVTWLQLLYRFSAHNKIIIAGRNISAYKTGIKEY